MTSADIRAAMVARHAAEVAVSDAWRDLVWVRVGRDFLDPLDQLDRRHLTGTAHAEVAVRRALDALQD